MNGTFNGVRLRRITSLKIEEHQTSFRIIESPLPVLEEQLRLGGPALLFLSDQIIEGTITGFRADTTFGYDITIGTIDGMNPIRLRPIT